MFPMAIYKSGFPEAHQQELRHPYADVNLGTKVQITN